MLKKLMLISGLMMSLCLGLSVAQAAQSLEDDLATLQHEWAKINYSTPANEQEVAFKNMIEHAHQLSAQHTNAPEMLIWEAIANASYAKAKGGIGALKYAEQARDLLLASEKADPNALNGSAYTTLGSLYYKVPGWPIGFGDKKKAKAYLEKALQMNPSGIDPNYFYADYLSSNGDYAKAIDYYNKALAAPARPGREDADAGRRTEVEAGLKNAQSKQ